MALQTLTDDMIRARAPSVFAEAAHDSRSERYAYIPTSRVLSALRTEGFEVTKAVQGRCRTPGKSDFTKHMLTLTRGSQMAKVGDSAPSVVLVNSHDGTSSYQITAGLMRLVCLNGMMVSEGFAPSVKVHHTGDIVGRVIEGSYSVIEHAARAGETAAEWKALALAPQEARAFSSAAMLLRWDGTEHKAPVGVETMLRSRRPEDNASDLWTTFNRVQENLLRGGQRGWNANNRRQTVRPVKGIDGDIKLNRALWALAEQMAAIKTGNGPAPVLVGAA